MRYHAPPGRRALCRRRGFTLLEAALATMIVGTGVVALLQLLAAGTMSTEAGTELTTAVNLANNIHEISVYLPFNDPGSGGSTTTKEAGGPGNYNDIWDLNGDTYSPPLDARRQPISGYSNWAQQVTVQSVAPDNLTVTRPNSVTIPTARVTVTITHNGRTIYSESWIVAAPNS